jgi:hypothetical protein
LIEPALPVEDYFDGFGNHCGRVNAPAGVIRFLNDATIRDPGELDAYAPEAPQLDVRETPVETLSFLMPSRYCDGDTELLDFAGERLARLQLDGRVCRPFATSSTPISASTTRRLALIAPVSILSASGLASVAILPI